MGDSWTKALILNLGEKVKDGRSRRRVPSTGFPKRFAEYQEHFPESAINQFPGIQGN
jgi:hypothetical protein